MPAFMSNVPGPWSAIAVAAKRHPLQRADRPHGVEVPEQQHRPAVAAEARPNDDRRAPLLGIRSTSPPSARSRSASARPQPIDRGLVGARRLEPHERFDEGEQVVEMGFAVASEGPSFKAREETRLVAEAYNIGHGCAEHESPARYRVVGVARDADRGLAAGQTPQPFPRPGTPKPASPAADRPRAAARSALAAAAANHGADRTRRRRRRSACRSIPGAEFLGIVRRRPRSALLPLRHQRQLPRHRQLLQERAEAEGGADLRGARRFTSSTSAGSAKRRWRFRRA